MSTRISESSLGALRRSMRGEVVTPADTTYDEARKVWNGDIDRRPAAIARCAGVDDIRAALAFGRVHGLRIAVRAGGHSFPGHSTADGALVIDLRAMNQVTVDEAGRDSTVQWVRGFSNALEPHAHGAYINLTENLDEPALERIYGGEKYARLRRLKAKYDPENVFRLNQNISPAS